MSSSAFGRVRRRPFSVTPFVKALGLLSILCALALFLGPSARDRVNHDSAMLGPRGLQALHVRDQECRLVHTARDQCQFIKANCQDEEAGLLDYLSLYYCKLPHQKPIAFIILILWISLLFATIGIAASDFFCVNLGTISAMMGMSESLAGVTLLAFGNGSADVFSTFAAMSTHSGSLAVGELIGAAGFITAVVAGSMALARPFKVSKYTFVRDVGFFAVAASFSMTFLSDGHLHLWECIVMIVFYAFYVVFVVVWDWWLNRRRRQRHRINTAREHFRDSGRDANDPPTPYHDADNEHGDGPAGEQTSLLGPRATDDFGALERAGMSSQELEADDDEEIARERYLTDISNMRVDRRPIRSRRSTAIRPSLVGALEFQSVLSSLQKSRNLDSAPINLRRYSDDPTYGINRGGSASVPALAVEYDNDAQMIDSNNLLTVPDASNSNSATAANRQRAVSAGAATTLRLDTSQLQSYQAPDIDLSAPTPPAAPDAQSDRQIPPSPSLSVTPPPSLLVPTPELESHQISDHLAPPTQQSYFPTHYRPNLSVNNVLHADSPIDSPKTSRKKNLPAPSRLAIPSPDVAQSSATSSPSSPFPRYTDSPLTMSSRDPSTSRAPSIRLPPPSVSPDLYHSDENIFRVPTPPRWWPFWLPSPYSLLTTLFPTLCNLRSMTIWGKFLAIVAAPPILILKITLPVVENESPDDEKAALVAQDGGALTPGGQTPALRSSANLSLLPEDNPRGRSVTPRRTDSNLMDTSNVPTTSMGTRSNPIPPSLPVSAPPKNWPRWLFIIQIFLAPLFVAAIIHLNSEPSYTFLKPCLICLVISLLLLALLLSTTSSHSETVPKRWRAISCTIGFVVSVAWISTIAGEVVGVLKAFGVILSISDAILGLTVFAVGNSLGDLVADITVARLGHPVMALAACFGGPMLNILLGIGCGGLYMTVKKGAKHAAKHPGHRIKYKPYVIEIGSTLVISGATLLVILVGLLVVVPLNNWRMDRKIGWGLVVLWVVSTSGNLAYEYSNLGGKIS